MKNIYLPFKIGEQYENWEFDLDYLQEEKIKGFDSYIYLWKKPFLHTIPNEIELIFSLDILQVVIMTYEFQSLEQLSQFKEILQSAFDECRKFENEYLNAEIFSISGNIDLWLVYISNAYRIEISYGYCKYLKEIYN